MKSTENKRYDLQRLCYDQIRSDLFQWYNPWLYLNHDFRRSEILRAWVAIKNASIDNIMSKINAE